ncbi:MAG: helix-turn-helix domain-containing protein [Oscillospiraceae bacterium]|nr:helix-turn-helix domain-containing protein [Oscillospiraceae bacterium]MCI1990363.1 helix-turn-helix domain-containing protein [Oscillospiraceae bacterium]MCI2034697.1 helix-turn-helix domain-containing protein [Oscillospiraceae bacterium]
MLRNLLDPSSQRMMKILETLVASGGWVTAAELSEKAGASERTVAEDLAALKKRWGSRLRLETSTKNGVRARNRSVAVMGEIFMQLFRGSTALRWLEDIFFEPERGIEFYAAKLFSSRSTLNRLLPKVNAFLGERGMAVRRADGRYRISAENEQYLRQFYAGFLIELYGLDLKRHQTGLNPEIPGRIIRRILARNLGPEELSFVEGNHIAIAYYIMFYTVSLVRENQGYTVPSGYPAEKETGSGDLQYLRGIFPNISEANLRPVHQFIAGQYSGWSSGAEKALVAREADAFLQRVFRAEKSIPGADTLRLMRFILNSLYLNTKSRPFRTSMLFDRIRYFSAALKRTTRSHISWLRKT